MAEPQDVGNCIVPAKILCKGSQQTPCCQGLSRRVNKVQGPVNQFA
jgi:hypothetical protein